MFGDTPGNTPFMQPPQRQLPWLEIRCTRDLPTLSGGKNTVPMSSLKWPRSRPMQRGILVLQRPAGGCGAKSTEGPALVPVSCGGRPPRRTLSKSSLVSSVRGSWENMQSSPLMQFPVVWYNLHGKSRSRQIKANASPHGTHPRAEPDPMFWR